MMLGKRTYLVAAAALAAVTVLGCGLLWARSASARHGGGLLRAFGDDPGARAAFGHYLAGRMDRWATMQEDLNLTDAQRDQLRDLFRSKRGAVAPLIKDMAVRKQALRKAVLSDKPDEQAIRKAASDLGAAIGDASVAFSGIVSEARAFLTPEQIELLKDFRSDNEQAATALWGELGSRWGRP